MTLRNILMVGLLALTLSACHGAGEPSAPVQLPELERATATVGERGGRLLIPREALTERAGQPHVFVLSDGEARARVVEAGKREGRQVAILAGIWAGETVVVGDLDAVRDGSPVTPR